MQEKQEQENQNRGVHVFDLKKAEEYYGSIYDEQQKEIEMQSMADVSSVLEENPVFRRQNAGLDGLNEDGVYEEPLTTETPEDDGSQEKSVEGPETPPRPRTPGLSG